MKILSYILFLILLSSSVFASEDIGEEAFKQGNFDLAVEKWDEQLSKLSSEKDTEEYIDISIRLSAAYLNLGRLRDAIKILKNVEPLARKLDDPMRLAKVLMQFSDVYAAMDDLEYSSCGMTVNTANRGNNLKKAEEYLDEAERKFSSQGSKHDLLKANLWNKRGNILLQQKQEYSKILIAYKETLNLLNNSIKNDAEAKLLLVNTLLNITRGTIEFGETDVVDVIFNEFTDKRLKNKRIFEELRTLINNLSDSHDKVFALIDLAQQIKLITKKASEPENGQAKEDMEILIPSKLNPIEFRWSILTEAYKIANSLSNSLQDKYSINRYLSEVLADNWEYKRAVNLIKQYDYFSLKQSEKPDHFSFRHSNYFVLNRIYIPSLLDNNDFIHECKNACQKSFFTTEFLHDECKGKCQPILPILGKEYNPEQLFYSEWQLGKYLKWQSEKEPNTQQQSNCLTDTTATTYECAYKRASEFLKQADVSHTILSKKFTRKAKDFYFDWTDILLQDIKDKDAVDDYLEQKKLKEIIQVVEQFDKLSIQDYFQDRCITESKDKLTKDLPKGVAALYPLLFDDRIEFLLRSSQGIERVTKEFSSVEDRISLLSDISTFKESLSQNNTYEDEYSNSIYQWLIKPIEHILALKNPSKENKADVGENIINSLIIVPHDHLYNIPFSALHDKDTNKYFIEKFNFAVSYASSIDLTYFNNKPKNITTTLLGGSEEFPIIPPDIKPAKPLTFVPEELETISNVITCQKNHSSNDCQSKNQVVILKSDKDDNNVNDFTREKVMENIFNNSYNIIHFSTHTKFSSNINNIILLTSDGKLPINDLAKTIKSSGNSKSIRLITLSACETAKGETEKSEFRGFGLAGVLLKTEIPTILGTFGIVRDGKAGVELMEEFYKNIFNKNTTMAMALKEAKLKLLLCSGKTNCSYKNPEHWANFILVGNSQ